MPDSFLGGVLLSIINVAVVFAVLGFLALVIRAVAKTVNTAGMSRNSTVPGGTPDASGGPEGLVSEARGGTGIVPNGGAGVPPVATGMTGAGAGNGTGTGFTIRTVQVPNGTCGDLTVKEKAAVIAAVMAVMAGTGRRHVFVRGVRDSGAWGKLGKAGVVRQVRARR